MADCLKCGAFAGNEKWRTLCPLHFKAQKRAEERALNQQIEDLLAENMQLRAALRITEGAAMLAVEQGKELKITPARIRQLVQLCHPDKHGGSRSAVEVTQWLLQMRGSRK